MPSIPMYIAGLVVTCAGLNAAHLALEDASFSALIFGLTFIGFLASYITRLQNVAPRNVELPALIVCVCVVLMAVFIDPADSFLAPATVAEDRSKALALLLTWLTVFRSFTLTSDAALLFSCVPTIALLGLVGTSTSDPILITIFLFFVAAAIFMMVHENVRFTTWHHRQRRLSRRPSSQPLGWGGQIQATAVCTLLAVFIGNFATPYFQDAGAFVRINSGLAQMRISQDNRAAPSSQTVEDRTELQVGMGPVSLSDDIIFTVESTEAHNWRGPTFDRYTGRSWQNTYVSSAVQLVEATDQPTDPSKPDAQTYHVPATQITDGAKEFRTVDQHIRFVLGGTTEIYGAGEVRRVTLPRRKVLADEAGSLRLTDMLINAEYQVQSEVPEMTAAARKAPSGGYPGEILDRYLQLPIGDRDAMDRIRRAAADVTRTESSAYGKVEALAAWVARQCKYNTSTPRFPDNRDAVDYFLFEAQQGYCDSFATSLAVLCRTLEIPSRVVSGYLTGDLDSEAGQFVVREKHKHLWTEVYFNGVGWVPFDATSGAEDVSPARAQARQGTKGLWAALLKHGWWPPALILAALLLLVYVLKVEVFDRFIRPRREYASLGLPETNFDILMEYEAAGRALARRGLSRLPSETALEFQGRSRRALAASPDVTAPLDVLTGLVNTFRYSEAVADPSDVQRARESRLALNQALRSAPRRLDLLPAAAPETA